MILAHVDEAITSGATRGRSCAMLGLNPRTVQRWRSEEDGGEDRRHGPERGPLPHSRRSHIHPDRSWAEKIVVDRQK